MSGQWRTLLVKDDESVNTNIVSSLLKDGYAARGALTVAEAMRILWAEEFDVVICDLQAPGPMSLELLQWMRSYRPNARVILVGPADSEVARAQALESGAVAYLGRPLNLHLLKEELRRLLQQTGFSASLDSFDLLDVIQIINMSRKNIALLVSIGLEERGVLGFREGELIYAEYGVLRGEEAFFALAAHKNGTVVHQPWNAAVLPNVTQPLSRLILQALQYRSRVAQQQASGEQAVIRTEALSFPNTDDDRPFAVLAEDALSDKPFGMITQQEAVISGTNGVFGMNNGEASREWWQQTGKVANANTASNGTNGKRTSQPLSPTPSIAHNVTKPLPQGANSANANNANNTADRPAVGAKPAVGPVSQRQDLPSWLTDMPTAAALPVVRPSSLSGTGHVPATPSKSVPHSPIAASTAASAEWQPPQAGSKVTGPVVRKEGTSSLRAVNLSPLSPSPTSPAWAPPQERSPSPLSSLQSPLPPVVSSGGEAVAGRAQKEQELQSRTGGQPAPKWGYNSTALVSALQTMGYAVTGFIAAAVVTLDGQPIAQVAVDDLDISRICKHFSTILGSVLQSLDQGVWGEYEDTVITSADRHILMSLVGTEKNAFQVLITSRESDPIESLNVMANIESAITAALQA